MQENSRADHRDDRLKSRDSYPPSNTARLAERMQLRGSRMSPGLIADVDTQRAPVSSSEVQLGQRVGRQRMSYEQ
jgi:hypothetical protein